MPAPTVGSIPAAAWIRLVLWGRVILGALLLAHLSLLADGGELLQDTSFQRGFRTIAPKAGARVVLGQLSGERTGEVPVWDLDQWNSRFPFSRLSPAPTGSGLAYSNTSKWVVTDRGRLTLGVDSRPEYTNTLRHTPSEPWVHLLVEQPITNCPSLAALRALPLKLHARLLESETFRPIGYTADLHAAQFQLVVTLGNTRQGSPGFGDFLWFVVPLFDDRHAQPPRYVNRDFADPSAKLIFNPGTDAFTTDRLRDGKWVGIDKDLLPFLKEALAEGWRLGYLGGSRDLADYRLTTINIGWEVPGLNRVAIALRGLSLRAVTAEP